MELMLMHAMKILVIGANGWIGGQFWDLLESGGEHQLVNAGVRVDDVESMTRLLDFVKPTHVASFIGRTHGGGINTIDYLEQPGKLVENVRDNLFAPVALGLLCAERGIHLTSIGTGCVFSAEDPSAIGTGTGTGNGSGTGSRSRAYGEEDAPDFFGSSYSIVKGFTDRLLHVPYLAEHVLNVRIRMPIVDAVHPRNFITKIARYERVCSVANSMTVLPELLPLVIDMMDKKRVGTINLVNPGVISHNDILEMYREIVDPAFSWVNMSIEEQNEVLASKRSNNELDTGKLRAWYPQVTGIREAVRRCLDKMRL